MTGDESSVRVEWYSGSFPPDQEPRTTALTALPPPRVTHAIGVLKSTARLTVCSDGCVDVSVPGLMSVLERMWFDEFCSWNTLSVFNIDHELF